MKIKALIFDFDGLLVDTETPQMQTWQKLYHELGAELRPEEWVQCLGTSPDAFDPIADLIGKTTAFFDKDELKKQFKIQSTQAIEKERLRPGMSLLLKHAQKAGLSMAVASSSGRIWVESGLARVGAGKYFLAVCTAEDVTKVKPDPELFQLALRRLGINAHEAIVLEDSPMGIRAAKSAGLACVAYPNSISSHLDLSQADLIVTSPQDITLSRILSHFQDVQPL
ncbi:MAG TPA: HAD-IA family hydrolase [Longilinea sp.]|nr:HAD-IA family hydrolase [Longilinea sp.]